MTDTKQPMESPAGLELHPEPPPSARISKKVGVAVLGVVVLVGVLVVYGLYARREQQQVAQTKNEEKRPESARLATMGRRVGQKPVARVTEVIPPPADHRNYRRKRRCAWRHSDRSKKPSPRPRWCVEGVHCRVRPRQGRSMTPCNNLGRSLRSLGVEKHREARMDRR